MVVLRPLQGRPRPLDEILCILLWVYHCLLWCNYCFHKEPHCNIEGIEHPLPYEWSWKYIVISGWWCASSANQCWSNTCIFDLHTHQKYEWEDWDFLRPHSKIWITTLGGGIIHNWRPMICFYIEKPQVTVCLLDIPISQSSLVDFMSTLLCIPWVDKILNQVKDILVPYL